MKKTAKSFEISVVEVAEWPILWQQDEVCFKMVNNGIQNGIQNVGYSNIVHGRHFLIFDDFWKDMSDCLVPLSPAYAQGRVLFGRPHGTGELPEGRLIVFHLARSCWVLLDVKALFSNTNAKNQVRHSPTAQFISSQYKKHPPIINTWSSEADRSTRQESTVGLPQEIGDHENQ